MAFTCIYSILHRKPYSIFSPLILLAERGAVVQKNHQQVFRTNNQAVTLLAAPIFFPTFCETLCVPAAKLHLCTTHGRGWLHQIVRGRQRFTRSVRGPKINSFSHIYMHNLKQLPSISLSNLSISLRTTSAISCKGCLQQYSTRS